MSLDLVIRNVRRVGEPDPVDVAVAGGRIEWIAPADRTRELAAIEQIDGEGGLICPSFVEPHFHPDKTLTWSRLSAAVGWDEAVQAGLDVKRSFTADDVEARAGEAFRLAVAHGTGRMRAQVDIDPVTKLIGLEGVCRAAERFSGALDVEIVAFPQQGVLAAPGIAELLREALRSGATVVGGAPNLERSTDEFRQHLELVFDLAEEFDADVDVHVDFVEDPAAQALELLADETIARGYQGRVGAVHAIALASYDDDDARRTIDKVERAGIQICICPMGNLQVTGGTGRTAYGRGSSRANELLDAGVNVVAGSDNMNDVWYRFGRMDPLELCLVACLANPMRTDAEVVTAFEMVTTRAARYVGAPADGVVAGAQADLVLFEADNVVDLIRNVPGRRTTIKAGRVVGGIEARLWASDDNSRSCTT